MPLALYGVAFLQDGTNEDIAIGDMKNSLFSSTSITNGKAKAIVTNVGMHTEIGKIAKLLNEQTNDYLKKILNNQEKIIQLLEKK